MNFSDGLVTVKCRNRNDFPAACARKLYQLACLFTDRNPDVFNGWPHSWFREAAHCHFTVVFEVEFLDTRFGRKPFPIEGSRYSRESVRHVLVVDDPL